MKSFIAISIATTMIIVSITSAYSLSVGKTSQRLQVFMIGCSSMS